MAIGTSFSVVVIKNQVFISFRGDTRKNFTSHLYAALHRKRIQAYIDEEDLERGDEISPALLKAIEESLISIVVFSKEYASSRWCLDELVHILKCKQERGQIVLPIFYGVDPSDIRRQKRSYGDAFAAHENLLGHDGIKVKDWKDALTAAANLSGFNSQQYENESKLIEKIVEDVLKKLETLLKAGRLPGGMVLANHSGKPVEYIPGPSIEHQTTASRNLAELMNILDDDRFRRIGVWGMGGVGKTTLVKNLNNKLDKASSNQPFSIVIWATVSKNLDIKRLQKQIGQRLNLEVGMEESVERTASRLYQRLEREKFLLILDDVWESIDLHDLGIPQSEIHSASKILLTSRFFDVCQEMMTDVEVKVKTLSDEEAWKLFSQKAGEVANSEHVRPFAEAVVRECGGLPLALIIVGTAMRGKAMVELWEHTLKQLQRSVPRIRGVKDKVYNYLKWSYDSLEGNNVKACFLYCALYPEDFSIDVNELVECWLAEGLTDEQQNFEESVNEGIVIVETLKASCLLEDGAREGSVKMHDVVRDVAIWIASSLEHGFRSLFRSGIGLSEISVAELSHSLKRVSFVNNKIKELPDCATQCSEVLTLLLQDNLLLKVVCERFFQGFHALKVLNVSRTRIEALPPLQLHDLRALLLKDCFSLQKLPPLGGLNGLQILDLCATRIRELPQEMENLINLKKVNLSYTANLNTIQAGIISKWICLEVLDMRHSGYKWREKKEVRDGEANFEELGCLKRLLSLSVTLGNISCLGSIGTWIKRVRRFEFVVGSNPPTNSVPSRHDERMVAISRPYVRESVVWSLINPCSLVLNCCDKGLSEMLEDIATSCAKGFAHSSSLRSFSGLKSLSIMNCSLQPGEGYASPYDLLPNLEELRLENLSGLKSISQLLGHLGLRFLKLKLIEVSWCDQMKCLILYGNFITALPNVETIRASFCYNLEELFHFVSEEPSPVQLQPIVPKLQRLELKTIPKLRNLCRPEESWPSLEQVDVVACDQLVKLPLTLQNVSTIKEIRGESTWWSRLEFDNENTKSTLQLYFRPYLFQSRQTEEKHILHSEVIETRPIFTSAFGMFDNEADPMHGSMWGGQKLLDTNNFQTQPIPSCSSAYVSALTTAFSALSLSFNSHASVLSSLILDLAREGQTNMLILNSCLFLFSVAVFVYIFLLLFFPFFF